MEQGVVSDELYICIVGGGPSDDRVTVKLAPHAFMTPKGSADTRTFAKRIVLES